MAGLVLLQLLFVFYEQGRRSGPKGGGQRLGAGMNWGGGGKVCLTKSTTVNCKGCTS